MFNLITKDFFRLLRRSAPRNDMSLRPRAKSRGKQSLLLLFFLLLAIDYGIACAGQLLFDGVPVDITTTTNEDLVIAPGTGGNTQIGDAAGTNTNATSNDDLHITGILETDGAVYLNSATTLGDSTSDTITVTGYLGSHFIPATDSTYDFGSSSLAWRYLYVDIISGYNAALALNPASGYSLTGSVTKNTATGNEVAYDLDATINKSTSGNYTAIELNVTETSAPGAADLLLDLQVAGASMFNVDNAGNVTAAGTITGAGSALSGTTSNTFEIDTDDSSVTPTLTFGANVAAVPHILTQVGNLHIEPAGATVINDGTIGTAAIYATAAGELYVENDFETRGKSYYFDDILLKNQKSIAVLNGADAVDYNHSIYLDQTNNVMQFKEWTTFRWTNMNPTALDIMELTRSAGLDVFLDDALNSNVTDVFTIRHTTSGAPAATIGVGQTFHVEDAGGVEEQGSIDVLLTTVTDGAEDADMVFQINQAGTISEIMRLDGSADTVTVSGGGLLTLGASNQLTIDGATTDSTTTTGVINLDVDSLTNNNVGMDLDYETTGATVGATNYTQKVSLTQSATAARTLYGYYLTATDASALASTLTGIYVDVTTANAGDTVSAATLLGGKVEVGAGTTNANATGAGELYVQNDLEVDGTLYAQATSASGALNMNNNIITNIGNTGTDFDANGGLTLAGDVAVNGDDITSDGDLAISPAGEDLNVYAQNGLKVINDATATDTITILHNDTDGHITTSVGDIHLEPTGDDVEVHSNAVVKGDTTLKVYDSDDTDYISMNHNSSDSTLENNVGNMYIKAVGGSVYFAKPSGEVEDIRLLDGAFLYLNQDTAYSRIKNNWRNTQFDYTAGGANKIIEIGYSSKDTSDSLDDAYIYTRTGDLFLQPNGGDTAITGNLGVGDNTPDAELDVEGTAPTLYLTDSTASAKSLAVDVDANLADLREIAGASGSLMTLDLSNNRVGINTNSPNTALQIGQDAGSNGSIQVTADYINGLWETEANARWSLNRDMGGAGYAGIGFGPGGATAIDSKIWRQSGGQLRTNCSEIQRDANDSVLKYVGGTSNTSAASIELYGPSAAGNQGRLRFILGENDGATKVGVGMDIMESNTWTILMSMDTDGKAVFNSAATGLADFQVKGDTNDNTFYVDTSADSVGIGTTTPSGSTTAGTCVLALLDGTAPIGGRDLQALFYSDTVATSTEMFVMDEAGNATQISPHDPETGEWIFYSKNTKTGRVVRVDMERLVKSVEKLTGEKFMVEKFEEWGE